MAVSGFLAIRRQYGSSVGISAENVVYSMRISYVGPMSSQCNGLVSVAK